MSISKVWHLVGLICAAALALLPMQQASAAERFTLNFAGVQRDYLLQVPGYTATPRPLVIVLHGGGGNAMDALRMTGFARKAVKEQFVAVFPEGTARFGDFRTWNAGHCCAYAAWQKVDDIGFLDAVIDDVGLRIDLDPDRIFVTGMSNGAMMAHQVGIQLSHRIAAIAPVAGALFGDEQLPEHPVSAFIINGGQDQIVPVAGGVGIDIERAIPAKDMPYAPAEEQLKFWAKANGCTAAPQRNDGAVLYIDVRAECKSGTEVTQIRILDGVHDWPNGRSGLARAPFINATNEIWEFFEQHPKNKASDPEKPAPDAEKQAPDGH